MQEVSFGIGELHIDLSEAGVYGGDGSPREVRAGGDGALGNSGAFGRKGTIRGAPVSANVVCPWAISEELEGEPEQEKEREKDKGQDKDRERFGRRKSSTVVPPAGEGLLGVPGGGAGAGGQQRRQSATFLELPSPLPHLRPPQPPTLGDPKSDGTRSSPDTPSGGPRGNRSPGVDGEVDLLVGTGETGELKSLSSRMDAVAEHMGTVERRFSNMVDECLRELARIENLPVRILRELHSEKGSFSYTRGCPGPFTAGRPELHRSGPVVDTGGKESPASGSVFRDLTAHIEEDEGPGYREKRSDSRCSHASGGKSSPH